MPPKNEPNWKIRDFILKHSLQQLIKHYQEDPAFSLFHRKIDNLQFPPRLLEPVIDFVKTHSFFHQFQYESVGLKVITVKVKSGGKPSTNGLPGSAHCTANGLETIRAKMTAFFALHSKTVYDQLSLGQAIESANFPNEEVYHSDPPHHYYFG